MVGSSGFITTVALAVIPWLSIPKPDPVQVEKLVKIVSSKDRSVEDRHNAGHELTRHHPEVVLPALLAEIERVDPDHHFHAGTRFDPAHEPPGHALRRVWREVHLTGWKLVRVVAEEVPAGAHARVGVDLEYHGPAWRNAAVSKALVDMLKKTKSRESQILILPHLRNRYRPEAEAILVDIHRQAGGLESVYAAEILLENHPRKYAGDFIDRIADVKLPTSARKDYLSAFQPHRVFRELEARDHNRLVREGFALLSVSRNYFTAGTLSDFVGVEFNPDSNDPRYQDGRSLNQRYFDDTVENALEWWKGAEAV